MKINWDGVLIGVMALALIGLLAGLSIESAGRCKRVLAASHTAHDSLLVYVASAECR